MSEEAVALIKDYAQQGAKLRVDFCSDNSSRIVEIARTMAVRLVHGGKILLCGNGGSAADAQHIAAEFVNKFQMERPPLPALALTTDTSVLTAIGNDDGFRHVFSKQAKALAGESDVFVGISTSGRSEDVNEALRCVAEKGIVTVGLTGRDGGEMNELCDFVLRVPSENTALIQEVHITAGHLMCRLVDYFLFEAVDKLQPYI
jgi:D-sedoheptulose 7-phosphate isomerase